MKKEILPKLLKKILESKLQIHMTTLKFGLMTLKQDKKLYRIKRILRLVQVLEGKRQYDMKRGLAMLFTYSLMKEQKKELSMFDLSNIDEFVSFKDKSIKKSILESISRPRLTKDKLKAAGKFIDIFEKKIMSLQMDFWLPLRVNDQQVAAKSHKRPSKVLTLELSPDLF